MKRIVLLGLAALGIAGCAKSPDDGGGPTPPQAVNRMTVSMTLAQPVGRTGQPYFYDFAFDDNSEPQDAPDFPVAIVGQTALTNGVVGGSFTVLVECVGGRSFNVYRRTRVPNGEELRLVRNAFVTQPTVQTGRTLTFTLNLDATYSEDPDNPNSRQLRLFRNASGGPAEELDINFVTTDEVRRDPNNNLPKNFDAFFANSPGRKLTLDIRGSRSISNRGDGTSQSSGVEEPADDVRRVDTSGRVEVERLEITDFRIDIRRSSN